MIRNKFLLSAILLTFLSAASFAAPKAAFSNAKVVSVHRNISQAVDDGTHCNLEDLDGYCQQINPVIVVQDDVEVQQADGSTLGLVCTTSANASDCANLSTDQAVSTKAVGNEVELSYQDASDHVHTQFYQVVRSADAIAVGE